MICNLFPKKGREEKTEDKKTVREKAKPVHNDEQTPQAQDQDRGTERRNSPQYSPFVRVILLTSQVQLPLVHSVDEHW